MDEKLIAKSKIKEFKITGLFGYINVTIPFDKNVKILVGENGSGKTTILSALYYLLSGNFYKLSTIEFDYISITFLNGKEFSIKKEEIGLLLPRANKFISWLKEIVPENEFQNMLIRIDEDGPKSPYVRKMLTEYSSKSRLHIPYSALVRELEMIDVDIKQLNDNDRILNMRKELESEVTEDIIYLPTYRRIEEDLQRLGLGNKEIEIKDDDNILIQFGMKDVNKRFNEITSIIKDSAVEWFSKINGEMLGQLVEGIKVTNEMRNSIKQPEALKIVLDRVGQTLSDTHKQNIYYLITSNTIADEKYDPLVYFLSNLIKIYDQQRERDNLIKRFADVCNKYLVGKRVIYNESTVEIKIVQNLDEKPIDINKLSSGEKQIVSLFARLYLNSASNFIILFDEPELSLSINWQRHLLPDILESKKCSFLFATTHSPFIFDNELDMYTTGLDMYIQEVRK